LNTSKRDEWKCVWQNGEYFTSKYYALVHEPLVVCLNTRDLLKRSWKVTDDNHCELCPGRDYDDRQHLFFECNFGQRI
jgi:hypothetical protein